MKTPNQVSTATLGRCPMPHEDAATKAKRLLAEGAVTVRRLADDAIEARVRGDSARVYDVRWSPAGWSCPCDASMARCSHVRSVQLIVLAGDHGAGDRP